MTPLSAHQKSYGPPFQLIKKVMTHTHILPAPPPVEIMNGPLSWSNYLFHTGFTLKIKYRMNTSHKSAYIIILFELFVSYRLHLENRIVVQRVLYIESTCNAVA